jgi:multicomponent Na+:H+ antiporter subunit G
MTPMDWVATAFMVGGAFFLLVSALGLLRLPDFFSRSHAVGKSETLGSLLFLVGLGIHNGFALESAKLGLILFFIGVTNPSGIHVLSRAALRKGLEIWVHPKDREAAQARVSEAGLAAEAGARPPELVDEADPSPLAAPHAPQRKEEGNP